MTATASRLTGPLLPRRSRAGWRLAFTIAARTARRSPGRNLLIAALIALPVAGIVGATTVGVSMIGSPARAAAARLGAMSARLSLVGPMSSQDDLGDPTTSPSGLAELTSPTTWVPDRWRVFPVTPFGITLRTARGVAIVQGVAGRTWDRGFAGRFELLDGRAPRTDDEILVTPSALMRFGIGLGGALTSGDGTQRFTVVGTMRDETVGADQSLVFGTASAFAPEVDQDLGDPSQRVTQSFYYLAGPPVTRADLPLFNQHGAVVLSRALTAPHDAVDIFGPSLSSFDSPGAWGASSAGSVFWGYAALIGVAGGFALFEVVLLAGAGFLVGARQQQRALAVLASVGADRRLLSRAVSMGGLVIGAVGAVAGIALGLAGAAVAMAATRDGTTTQFYGFAVDARLVAAIAVVAVLAAWIAAAIPARSASRFDVVATLRGARRPPRPSRRAPAIGVLTMLVGAGLAVLGGVLLLVINGQDPRPQNLLWIGPTLIVIGSIALQLGAILGVPLLLRLVARLAGRRASGRMATRDLARNSGRSVPAVAAIMSTMFVAAFGMAVISGGERQADLGYEYHAPANTASLQLAGDATSRDAQAALAEVRQVLRSPRARVVDGVPDAELPLDANGQQVTTGPTQPALRLNASARCLLGDAAPPQGCRVPSFLGSGGYGAHIVVGDEADLTAVLGRTPSATGRRALADGRAVALFPQYVHDGQATIDWWTPEQLSTGAEDQRSARPDHTRSIAAVLEAPPHPGGFGIVISPAAAARLGLEVRPRVVLAPFRTPPTAEQQDRIAGYLATRATTPDAPTSITIEQGPAHWASGFAWIILGVAGLITLGSSVIALGLARLDGRRDEQTLGAVGAPPRVLRRIAFWQALVIAGLGSVIGGVFALVPALALALSGTTAFDPPWLQLAASVVAVPLVIAAVTAATRRVRRSVLVDRTAIG